MPITSNINEFDIFIEMDELEYLIFRDYLFDDVIVSQEDVLAEINEYLSECNNIKLKIEVI